MSPIEVRARLQACGKAIEAIVGKDVPFALLCFPFEEGGKTQRCEYISNGAREEVWRSVAEWVLKTPHKPLGDS